MFTSKSLRAESQGIEPWMDILHYGFQDRCITALPTLRYFLLLKYFAKAINPY